MLSTNRHPTCCLVVLDSSHLLSEKLDFNRSVTFGGTRPKSSLNPPLRVWNQSGLYSTETSSPTLLANQMVEPPVPNSKTFDLSFNAPSRIPVTPGSKDGILLAQQVVVVMSTYFFLCQWASILELDASSVLNPASANSVMCQVALCSS